MGEAGHNRAPGGVGGQDCGPDRREAYEPPAITVLGSLAELTQGNSEGITDGTFPGSLLK